MMLLLLPWVVDPRLHCWCLLLLLLCCDAFVCCLLWCWCRAWQNEMWIVVWWTWRPWRAIEDVHHLSIVLPWFDLSSGGSCCDDFASNPNVGFSWWCVFSKPDAWIESVLELGILLDDWSWHVENAFSKLADGSLVVWLQSSEVAGYPITVDEIVVGEKSAVLDKPWHDWVLHANIEPIFGSDVLSDDTCLSKACSMESLDPALALGAVGWWMPGWDAWHFWCYCLYKCFKVWFIVALNHCWCSACFHDESDDAVDTVVHHGCFVGN